MHWSYTGNDPSNEQNYKPKQLIYACHKREGSDKSLIMVSLVTVPEMESGMLATMTYFPSMTKYSNCVFCHADKLKCKNRLSFSCFSFNSMWFCQC
mgnify:CR=1 FL=1